MSLYREIAWWKLNDNAATPVVQDVIGTHNGALASANTPINTNTQATTGKIDGAISIPVVGSINIMVDDSDDFTFGNGTTDSPFSIAGWIKISSYGWRSVITKFTYPGYPEGEWGLRVRNSSNVLGLILVDDTAKASLERTGNTVIPLATWTFVCATYNGGGSLSDIKLYVNATEETSYGNANVGTYGAMENTSIPVGIGGRWVNSTWLTAGDALDGDADEVRLYNFELSQAQIDFLYNGGNGTALPLQPAVRPLP